jgi:C4-dicarboxylate-specific signal transduction histidine kinase
MSQPHNAVPAPLSTPLARALDQNETVQETVEQSADELLLINTVLKQEIPDHIQTDAVAQALQQGDELESKIQESAENLAQVNQALEHEIAERAELERELADTKAALAEAQSQPSAQ